MTHLICNIGSDTEPVYRFRYGLWTTESGSLHGSENPTGSMQYVFQKNGVYANPIWNSYLMGFAQVSGWEMVVAFPSHHIVVDGPSFDGTDDFVKEFNNWYSNLPVEGEMNESDLLGERTIQRLVRSSTNPLPEVYRAVALIERHFSETGGKEKHGTSTPTWTTAYQKVFGIWKDAELRGKAVSPVRFAWELYRQGGDNNLIFAISQFISDCTTEMNFDVLIAVWEQARANASK